MSVYHSIRDAVLAELEQPLPLLRERFGVETIGLRDFRSFVIGLYYFETFNSPVVNDADGFFSSIHVFRFTHGGQGFWCYGYNVGCPRI